LSILVQVSELVERVRLDCGLPTYSSDTNITSAAVLDFVKRSAQKLSGIVQRAGADQHYLTTTASLATTAGVAVVSLPVNTMNVIRVGMTVGGHDVQLEPAPIGDWDPAGGDYLTSLLDAVPRYRLIGNTLTFYPTPNYVRPLTVYYTLGFTVSALSDYLALQAFWDEYIVNNCNVLVRNRQEKAAAEFAEERDRNEGAIVQQIRRDRAGVRQIRDVREPPFGWRGRRGGWY
jgi:hypothetical protein